MARFLAAAALALAFAADAHAQSALAPWFDADGFYNKPNVEFARATNDLTVCRAEAARLKVVRNTNTSVGSATAFNANGRYDPVVSGAATGIASIMFAIQDGRYNGSIEQIEFRDCIVALGFRHYRLSESDRTRFDSQPDRGFAALVSATAPADGRLNEGETGRNYYAAGLIAPPFENGAQRSAGADGAAQAFEPLATQSEPPSAQPPPASTAPATVVARLGPGETASPQPGMAIVVASARQKFGPLQIPTVGDTFRFRRVTADGRFADLVQPTVSFALRSHFKRERRRDPTLDGEFEAPRYSTYQIPAGRYVLSDIGTLNACLGTLAFEAAEGDVVYLGEYFLQTQRMPTASLFNPLANINSGMDNRLRADLRVGVGDDLEGARQALQADADTKARLTRASYQNGYRIPCDGRYIGRIANTDWPDFNAAQPSAFHDAMAAAIAAAQ